MDLEGNIKHWRSICWERGTQHIKLTMLFAEPPCLYPLLPVDNNCVLQSPVQKTCCSLADFDICKCLMFVPKMAKWALLSAQLNSDWRAIEASKREFEIWEPQNIHGRPTTQQQHCRGVLGRGASACRGKELRQEGFSAVFCIAESKYAYRGVGGTAGTSHAASLLALETVVSCFVWEYWWYMTLGNRMMWFKRNHCRMSSAWTGPHSSLSSATCDVAIPFSIPASHPDL